MSKLIFNTRIIVNDFISYNQFTKIITNNYIKGFEKSLTLENF